MLYLMSNYIVSISNVMIALHGEGIFKSIAKVKLTRQISHKS